MNTAIRVLLFSIILTGCGRFYWSKPGGTFEAFTADHHTCAREVGIPSPDGARAFVSTVAYRECLTTRGWARERGIDPGRMLLVVPIGIVGAAAVSAPAANRVDQGKFRGVEDDEIVNLTAPPMQPAIEPDRPSPGCRNQPTGIGCRR